MAAENAAQYRSRHERTLNVPRGYASCAVVGAALLDSVLSSQAVMEDL